MNAQSSSNKAHVLHYIENQIGYLTFCNPSKHNALPQEGWLAVAACVQRLVEGGARAIIVSGDGRSFCAGADISEFDQVRKNVETAQQYEQSNINAFAALRHAPVPTIARIKGYCLGGGFGLAAACDLRLATQNASFGVPAAKLGLGYPVAAMADIVHALGAQNAKLMLFTARRFNASEMYSFGFLNAIVEQEEELINAAQQLAEEIVELAPLTHHATKAAIAAIGGNEDDKAKAATISDKTFTSKDYAEGRKAFKERRAAHFTGQ